MEIIKRVEPKSILIVGISTFETLFETLFEKNSSYQFS